MTGLPAFYGLGALANAGICQAQNLAAYQQQANTAQMLANCQRAMRHDPYRNVARPPLEPHHARIKRMADWLEAQLDAEYSHEIKEA